MRNTFFQYRVKGAMMVELLISVLLLSVGVVGISSVVSQSMKASQMSKERIIATNLAREGIEAVRNIRDNNWLRYGNNKRVCWNFWENTDENDRVNQSDTTCSTGPYSGMSQHPIGMAVIGDLESSTRQEIKIKSYLVNMNFVDYRWNLVENFNTFDDSYELIPTYNDPTKTYGDSSVDWNTRRTRHDLTMDLYLDNITNLYTHNPTDSSNNENEITPYMREILISYVVSEDVTGDGESDGFLVTGTASDPASDNQILIQSIVYYLNENNEYEEIMLELEITDYLDRDNWFD